MTGIKDGTGPSGIIEGCLCSVPHHGNPHRNPRPRNSWRNHRSAQRRLAGRRRRIHAVGVDGDRVAVEITLGYPAQDWRTTLAAQIKVALENDPAIAQAVVSVTS